MLWRSLHCYPKPTLTCNDFSISLQVDSPKAEEVECLCKLMSTIGHLLDASKKGTERMDAYFMRMQKVKEAKSLESRHRFLIQVGTESAPCLQMHLQMWNTCAVAPGGPRMSSSFVKLSMQALAALT